MNGAWIDISRVSGGSFRAYLTLPEKGSGPGVVLCHDFLGLNRLMRDVADGYAAEGYAVIAPDLFSNIKEGIELEDVPTDKAKGAALGARLDIAQAVADIEAALRALRAHPACKGMVGALGMGMGGVLAMLAAARMGLDCAVSYDGDGIARHLDEIRSVGVPMVLHVAAENQPPTLADVRAALAERNDIEIYVYPGAARGFAVPGSRSFHKPSATLAHSRSLGLLLRVMGPYFNLSDLWEAHIHLEFVARDADATMRTMVAAPYVNHVPTMTGGYGHKDLHRFYKHHFIFNSPRDTKIVPISRTVGVDRVVDEGLFCFTHDVEIDWMLPGIAPTGKYVEIPLVAVVNFRGGKIYNEHIYWDQASVLVQIGLIDPRGLPVAGIETARKMIDPSQPSNTLMARWRESENR